MFGLWFYGFAKHWRSKCVHGKRRLMWRVCLILVMTNPRGLISVYGGILLPGACGYVLKWWRRNRLIWHQTRSFGLFFHSGKNTQWAKLFRSVCQETLPAHQAFASNWQLNLLNFGIKYRAFWSSFTMVHETNIIKYTLFFNDFEYSMLSAWWCL